MNDLDWSTIVRRQDDYVHQSDHQQHERKLRLKSLYKNQLEKMIEEQRRNARGEKDDDRRLIRWIKEKQEARLRLDEEEQLKKNEIKGKIARENLYWTEQRNKNIRQQIQSQKKFYVSRYRKAMTEVEQQSSSRLRQRQEERSELSHQYDRQIQAQQLRKRLEKLEDQKFAKLMQEIEAKKQENRRAYFEKLKNGYQQNPEVYQLSASLLRQKQMQRVQFINKMSVSSNKKLYSDGGERQQQKNMRVQETSSFNKQFFENKIRKSRDQSLNQINQFKNRNKTLQEQLYRQREIKLRELDHKKKQLKLQLERQIAESSNKKYIERRMNEKQYRINRSSQMPALPGLCKDYAAQKQQQIIETFLKSSPSNKIK